MIQYTCPHCSKPLEIPDHFAGGRGRCNHCNERITVPHTAPRISKKTVHTPQERRSRKILLISGGAALVVAIAVISWTVFDPVYPDKLARETVSSTAGASHTPASSATTEAEVVPGIKARLVSAHIKHAILGACYDTINGGVEFSNVEATAGDLLVATITLGKITGSPFSIANITVSANGITLTPVFVGALTTDMSDFSGAPDSVREGTPVPFGWGIGWSPFKIEEVRLEFESPGQQLAGRSLLGLKTMLFESSLKGGFVYSQPPKEDVATLVLVLEGVRPGDSRVSVMLGNAELQSDITADKG